MSDYIIKNGFVFDPLTGIKGDKKDIGIKDGKIVASHDTPAHDPAEISRLYLETYK